METDSDVKRVVHRLMSPEFWEEAWNASAERSPIATHLNQSKAGWTPFWNAVSSMYFDIANDPLLVGERIVELFFKEDILRPGCRALDIGCGPGSFALPMAEREVHVVAVDAAVEMLQVLRKEAKCRGLDTVYPLCQTFEDLTPEPRYDLVLAAFCPAIRNSESLLRMEGASKEYCALVLPSDQAMFTLRNELWKKLMNESLPLHSYPPLYALTFLCTSGRHPHLKQMAFPLKPRSPELLERYFARYFALWGVTGDEVYQAIHQTLHEQEQKIEANQETTVSVLWWKVRTCRGEG